VSPGRKSAANSVDGAVIKRSRKLAEFCLSRHPWTEDGVLKRERSRTQRSAAALCESARRMSAGELEMHIKPLAELAIHLFDLDGQECEFLLVLAADLIERGEPLPPSLRPLVGRTLRQPRPPLRLTMAAIGKHTRDRGIARAVEAIILDSGLKPTRNRARRAKDAPQSACSIVAQVLGNRKISLSEDAVEKIWSVHAKQLEKDRRRRAHYGLEQSIILDSFRRSEK
jgi:hypothetical protein